MINFFVGLGRSFIDSAKSFNSIRALALMGLLLALRTVLAYFLSIQLTDTMRISLTFLANVIIGVLFGPVVGFVTGGVGDLIQFVIKPTGGFFPGWTFNAALSGFVFGLFLHKRLPKKFVDIKYILLITITLIVEMLVVNVFFGTLWCTVMYSKGFAFYFTSRFTKNLIQLPINIFIAYVVLWLTRKVLKSANVTNWKR